jgi:hypothetical protein
MDTRIMSDLFRDPQVNRDVKESEGRIPGGSNVGQRSRSRTSMCCIRNQDVDQ